MDWVSTLIGAAIGFVSSIGILFAERILDRTGKTHIYVKIVNDRGTGKYTWGFKEFDSGISFHVPLWMELENTSNTTRVLRDVNLVLFQGKTRITEMVQFQSNTLKDKEPIVFGNDGSYSFVLEPRSIHKYEYHFGLKMTAVQGKHFDQVKLRYYDELDREHLFLLGEVDGDWQEKQFPRSGKWQKMK